MAVTNFSKARKIPNKVSTRKSAPTTTNFAKGIYTYKPNDAMDFDEIYLAQNARFNRIGEYMTRPGISSLSEPIGKTKVVDTIDMTNYDLVNVEDVELHLDTDGLGLVYSIVMVVNRNADSDGGVLQLQMVEDFCEDDVIAGISCAAYLTSTPFPWEFKFKNGISGTTRIRFTPQGNYKNTQFKVACIPGTHTPMYQLYTATYGKVTSMFEANIEGTKTVLFTFQPYQTGVTTLYRMDDEGTVTSIRQLPSDVERVRYSQNGDQIRYADGQEGPRIINTTTWVDSAITTTDLTTGTDLNIKVSNILTGTEDNIVYFDADTTTQAVWTYPYGFAYAPEADYLTTATIPAYVPGQTITSTVNTSTLTPTSDTHTVASIAVGDLLLDDNGNYGQVTTITGSDLTVTTISHVATAINSYDKFDRSFRQNFPAIKTGDPLTAMFNLGGVIYFLTRHNKYYMYSQTADVWTQQASSAQHGTFSQESCVCDLNYAYYANDDGIYVFDGSSEASITQNTIQSTYDALQDKENLVLELHNNRLYVFYENDDVQGCLVYNINLRLWESFDTGLPIASAIGRRNASNRLLGGSKCFGQIIHLEREESFYDDMTAPIDFDLETSYLHFGTPSQLHRITKWRPEFGSTPGNWTVKCGYALDFTDNVKYAFSINLLDQSIIHESYNWDEPPYYGSYVRPTKLSTIPQVNGQFYRCQIRYQHHAAFEPVLFKSHTISCETQRLR